MFKVILSFVVPLPLLFAIQVYGQKETHTLDGFFEKKMAKANIAGLQAALISKGELKWIGSYGKRNFQENTEVNDSTLFMIASCSKPVTALGLMKLYDRGLIDLDDAINAYVPFKIVNPNHPYEAITFRMLLAHTASFRDNTPLLVSLYTFDQGGIPLFPLKTLSRIIFRQRVPTMIPIRTFSKVALERQRIIPM